MKLELPVRWTEKDKENEKLEELIGETNESKPVYSYGRLLIDSEDIGPYYDIDENHTMINDKLGKVYCVTIPINNFKKIMTEVTGDAIMSIQVREEKPVTPVKRLPKPPKNDEDDILNI